MSRHSLIDTDKKPPAPVKVNGVTISAQAIAQETQNHPASRPEVAWQAAAEALVIREALLQMAEQREIEAAPQAVDSGKLETDEDARIRALVEQEVTTPEPDEDSCRRYYENNRNKLRTADLYEPAHILIQAHRDDTKNYEKCRNETCVLIAHLTEQPHDFERIARDRSDCPSSSDGGRLGQVTKGQTTPDFERAMFQLGPGEMTREPVETPYGFHIIRVDRMERGYVPEFELARPLVEEFLRDASWRRAVVQFVSLVVGEARIEGVELNGASSPLVQ